jgi:hypothetical protein
MDGAVALSPYSAVKIIIKNISKISLRVRGSQWCALKVTDASLPGAATDADLGGSSKYSSETLEDQCGEGFHVNSS